MRILECMFFICRSILRFIQRPLWALAGLFMISYATMQSQQGTLVGAGKHTLGVHLHCDKSETIDTRMWKDRGLLIVEDEQYHAVVWDQFVQKLSDKIRERPRGAVTCAARYYYSCTDTIKGIFIPAIHQYEAEVEVSRAVWVTCGGGVRYIQGPVDIAAASQAFVSFAEGINSLPDPAKSAVIQAAQGLPLAGMKNQSQDVYMIDWNWLIVELVLVLATITSMYSIGHNAHRIVVRKSRTKHHQCLTCGYSLDGMRAGACPECGKEIEQQKTKRGATTRGDAVQ